jgi:3-mercaptopyruvate sulfurtransferase SseA
MKIMRSFLLPVLAVSLTLVGFWYSRLPAPTVAPSFDQVKQEANQGAYRLITTDELEALYQPNPDGLLLVDTRQEWEYRTGHIKGAINFPMEPTWWARWRAKGPLKKFLGEDKQRTVVFY